jgi:hypothetical protein
MKASAGANATRGGHLIQTRSSFADERGIHRGRDSGRPVHNSAKYHDNTDRKKTHRLFSYCYASGPLLIHCQA